MIDFFYHMDNIVVFSIISALEDGAGENGDVIPYHNRKVNHCGQKLMLKSKQP